MAIKFEFYESPNPTGTEEKRFHARTVSPGNIDTDYLAKEIHAASTLTVADIKATLISLGEKLAQQLENGERIYLKDIPSRPDLSEHKHTEINTFRSGKIQVRSFPCRQDTETTFDKCKDRTLGY